MLVLAILLTY